MLAGAHLWIGDWRCPGERRAWMREVSHHGTLELQREGGHLRELGRARCVVDPTTVAIQPAGSDYRVASPTAHPQRSTVVLVAGEVRAAPGVRRLPPAAALLHHRLLTAREPVAREEHATALVHAILGAAVAPAPPVRASWRRVADEVQHVIATRHREPLSLAMLARAAGVSTFHLSRVFRAVTGTPVHQHLVRVRLRVALDALAGGGALTAIALAAGFSSHSHFTRAFRAELGVAPSALRATSVRARGGRGR